MTLLADVDPIHNPVVTGLANKNPDQASSVFATFFSALVGLILVAGTLWAFIQLLQGGLQWISSGGDKAALEGAQQRIIHALVGLFILFGAWAVFILIMNFFGITNGAGFNFKLPTLFGT